MTLRRVLPSLLTSAWLMLAGQAVQAGPNDILVGLDEKVFFEAEGQRIGPSGRDAVLVMDVSDREHPQIRASLPLMSSIAGPPTNLQITPDGRLGLVANSVVVNQNGAAWAMAPDDKLYVIDLAAEPPRLADTVTVGRQPSGLAISRSGDLALVANRAGKSVSVLSIQGGTVRVVGEVPMEDEVAAIAITPDGRRAFVCKNAANRIAVLAIDGQQVTYDKSLDIPTAFNPYNVAVTPDGRHAIVVNNGLGNGNVDTLAVIEATGAHPHVVDHLAVGVGPEGFAISHDGRWAVVPLLLGSTARHSAWNRTQDGAVALVAIGEAGQLRKVDTLPAGAIPEGVAFSPDGNYVYVGNYADRNVQVFRLADGRLVDTGAKISLPGQPASMRGPAR
jgi:DNA-binding beta-propeller fold protein YncE